MPRRAMTEKVHDFLTRPKLTRLKIMNIHDQMAALQSAQLPRAIRYDGDKVQISPGDPLAVYMERMEKLSKAEKELQNRYDREIQDIIDVAEMLSNANGSRIVVRIHVGLIDEKHKEYGDEAVKMGYSERQFWRLYRAALREMDRFV